MLWGPAPRLRPSRDRVRRSRVGGRACQHATARQPQPPEINSSRKLLAGPAHRSHTHTNTHAAHVATPLPPRTCPP